MYHQNLLENFSTLFLLPRYVFLFDDLVDLVVPSVYNFELQVHSKKYLKI